MATSYAGTVSATQVGSCFVQQYYQILQQQPDCTHQFYSDSSSIVRVDGETTESASALLQIHALIMSLNFTSIEIKTINSLESWSGGVLVVVSGSVKSKDFSGWRKFLQTFFLAPQAKGYFVLNDIFHFVNEEVMNQPPASGEPEVIHQTPVPVIAEDDFDSQPATSVPLQEPPVPDYAVEAEARGDVNPTHTEGDNLVEETIYQEQEDEPEPEPESEPEPEPEPEPNSGAETVEEGTPLEESSAFPQSDKDTAQAPLPAVEEPVGELPKLSYASILRAPKGNPMPTVSIQPSFYKRETQPALQPSNTAVSAVPDVSDDGVEESLPQKEGESKSIYVKNLSSSVSTLEVLEEFKNFGRIKQDGVFVNNRKDIGVCYAFVEFEDVQSAQNAVQASPIKFAGRQAYVELRKPNISNTTRGGRRGRGRGGRFGGWIGGRGSNLDGARSNGFRSS